MSTFRNLMAASVSGGGRLPSAYQEVEWIGSDSQQFIDTGVAGNNDNLEFEINCLWTTYLQYGRLFGNWINDSSNRWYAILASDGTLYINTNTVQPATVPAPKNTLHTIKVSSSLVSVDGHIGTLPTLKGLVNNSNIRIMTYYNTTTIKDIGLKVYSFKVSESGTPLRDFVPCYRKSDNEIGMYDMVNGVFYTNAGTGTFTKGTDVNE